MLGLAGTLIDESRIDLPEELATHGCRRVRLHGLRHCSACRRICRMKIPDPIGVPDAILVRPTIMVIFDAVKDEIIAVTPVSSFTPT